MMVVQDQRGQEVEASLAEPGKAPAAQVHGAPGEALKVCVISPLAYGLFRPDSGLPFGGAEVQFYLLSHELARNERRLVTVLTTAPPGQGAKVEQQGRVTLVGRQGRQRLSPPDGTGLPARAWGYLAAFADMHRQLRSIDADVYLHAGAGAEVGAYALICRLLGRRFVFVLASSADLGWPNDESRGPLPWLHRLGLRLAHAVVCRTEEQREALRRLHGRAGRVIRTGHPLPEEAGVEAARSAGDRHILWAGRLHPLKQPEMFLDLAERCSGERFLMVAMKDAHHPDLLARVRRRAGALPQVTLLEDLPLDRMDGVLARAKLFVNTSTYEGFPNTFVQAAMHGLPVLSWKVDPDGVLTKEGIGACAGGSFDALAAAVQGFCRDERLRRETGARARRYAAARHDLRQVAGAWDALLRELVGRRP